MLVLVVVSSFLLISLDSLVQGKIHYLSLQSDARRNILLTKFGYDVNGTFDFRLTHFTVPEPVLEKPFGDIGFTLSRGNAILEGTRSNPHVCQLQQADQNLDALFFKFDFNDPARLIINRTGGIQSISLCHSISCFYEEIVTTTPAPGFMEKAFPALFKKDSLVAYRDYIPLEKNDKGEYSVQFATRFNFEERGLYTFMYHNCFNYRAQGYSDRVAVDFTVNITEWNVDSYLSAGEIPKPQLYLYFAFLFMLATFMWINTLCKSESKNVYRVHRLMTALVFLKTLSLFFHGINYYFVGTYGHQKEIWAVVYYITHLLKGALLFGTIILIGTGYTFFKNFLSDRDRNLFMIILPLQVVDNIAMIIIEESEFAEQRYYFWFEIFIFLDLVCCMAIIFPVVWSMRHLQDGARTDGKAAFNLEKLRLFRHFYVIVISYIYLTRVSKFLVEIVLPFNSSWISELIVESSTFVFFCLVGYQFRPVKQNPYLKLSQDSDEDEEAAVALTKNGIFENVSRVQRITMQDEIDDIPGTIGGRDSSDDEDATLLPKTGRDMALSTL
uniref:Lung seven transmembrane receptor n=1 Tax=Acrobeloides nanus TaxID=290746 RepID=A0A914CYY1_9BILA